MIGTMWSINLVQILSADGTQEVGKITKQWSGLAKEYFTDADNFGIQCKCKCFDLLIDICQLCILLLQSLWTWMSR